jgi:hypothetical protein
MGSHYTVLSSDQQSPILKKLRIELEEPIPDPAAKLETIHLERLLYLSACIREGIRLSYGVSLLQSSHFSRQANEIQRLDYSCGHTGVNDNHRCPP